MRMSYCLSDLRLQPRILAATTFYLVPLVLLSGCSANFSLQDLPPTIIADEVPPPEPTPTPPPTRPPTETEKVLKAFQPSLAIRAGGCLMCHAQVHGSMISDFGYGDPWFMGGNLDPNSQPYYGNFKVFHYGSGFERAWQTARITNGSLIVPAADITRAALPKVIDQAAGTSGLASISLENFVKTPAADGAPAIASIITPPQNQAAVISLPQVYIGAPTRQNVLDLDTGHLLNSQSEVDFVQLAQTTGKPALSGLIITGNAGQKIVRNNPNTHFACYGDILIKGVLFLDHPIIDTDVAGCRLYVTDSVFIQNKVVFSESTGNLQISSAKAIALGHSSKSVADFLPLQTGATWTRPYKFTRLGSTNAAMLSEDQSIVRDANKISTLQEAITDCNYSFDHLLLNAPQILNHYCAPFTGALIAEYAIFRLAGNLPRFDFYFDPTFASSETPILPLFADRVRILEAK